VSPERFGRGQADDQIKFSRLFHAISASFD